MKYLNIFLDDLRTPDMSHNQSKGLGDLDWIVVRDYDSFVELIKKDFDNINLISFDHDLADFFNGEERTGKTATDFLINYCLDNDKKFPKNWYVHSDNTSGRANIIGAIVNYLDKVENIKIDFKYYNKGYFNGKQV